MRSRLGRAAGQGGGVPGEGGAWEKVFPVEGGAGEAAEKGWVGGGGGAGEEVFAGGGRAGEGVEGGWGGGGGGEGEVTAGEALGYGHEVGLNALVLDGEHFAGAGEAGGDLVADEKGVVMGGKL